MSSLAQRAATATWIMAGSILPCLEGEDKAALQKALDETKPYVLALPYARAMANVHKALKALVTGDELFPHEGILSDDETAATLYMCHALASDWADDCPGRPMARKLAWRHLANVIAALIQRAVEGHVDDTACAERGCGWAEKVKGVVK